MRELTMLRHGTDDGDCMLASALSIIGVDEVMPETPSTKAELWFADPLKWLQRERGYTMVLMSRGGWWAEDAIDQDMLCVLTGPANRSFDVARGERQHSCVGRVDGRVLWDPHPTRAGLEYLNQHAWFLVRCFS